jgi:hypothetical protein
VIPITRVVKLRNADPKGHSKISDLISSTYYLVTGLINKDLQEFFVSIIVTNAQCTLYKEQPYLSGHTDFEISFAKLQACLQRLAREVRSGQFYM